MNEIESNREWLDQSATPQRIVEDPLTNATIRAHSGEFYCIRWVTYYKREYLSPGDDLEDTAIYYFFSEASAKAAADWLARNKGDQSFIISDDISIFRLRLHPGHWDAIPDNHSDRSDHFDPLSRNREQSPIAHGLESEEMDFRPNGREDQSPRI